MTFTAWLLYVAAVLVLTVTPGPSVLMCISTSVNLGPRKALVASLGSTTAIVGIMALSALGLGTALAASESLFTALKWLGAAYLAYLGIKSLLSSATEIAVSGGVESSSTSRRVYAEGFLVGASNPKALLFFGALFPQFIVPSADWSLNAQFLLLATSFALLFAGGIASMALFSHRLSHALRRPARMRAMNRVTGGLLVGMGAIMVGWN